MSDRDRKQIVAEVYVSPLVQFPLLTLSPSNILKELDHEHIVRYHDRHVDRDAGILYILMEYCGGGDLSGVIKHAQKQNRPVPEDTIWNYFMQILLALQHCHHPPTLVSDPESKERRPQILHRDLKPDNGMCSVNICSVAHMSSFVFSIPRREQFRQTRRLWLVKSATTSELRQHLRRSTPCHLLFLSTFVKQNGIRLHITCPPN